jgi:hypothetical protein
MPFTLTVMLATFSTENHAGGVEVNVALGSIVVPAESRSKSSDTL